MEKSTIPRKPVLMSGSIRFSDSVLNCLVRNMTISGAALDVTEPYDLPECFDLVFKADGTIVPCRVVKKSGSAWPSTNPEKCASNVACRARNGPMSRLDDVL
jgi:hypothetical protein